MTREVPVLVFTVSCELPEPPVIWVGLKDSVGSEETTGEMDAVREVVPAKPPTGDTFTV